MIVPQPLSTLAIAAAGATTIILSAASMSNMYETYSLVQHHKKRLMSSPSTLSAASKRRALPPSSPSSAASKYQTWTTIDEALVGLKNMKKRDLLDVFLHCDPPAISDLGISSDDDDEGEGGTRYDGYLLDNGPILTPVTNFITNRLFGRGNQWLGKAYLNPKTSSNSKGQGVGRNRFVSPVHHQQKPSTAPALPNEFLDRTFDYSIGTSTLPSLSGQSKSLFQIYAPHCPFSPIKSPMSLIWNGMVDELRVLELLDNGDSSDSDNSVNSNTAASAKNDHVKILLGMGYFSWSGGVWNISPFCIVATQQCEAK